MFIAPVTLLNSVPTSSILPISGSSGLLNIPTGSVNNTVFQLAAPYSTFVSGFTKTNWPEGAVFSFRINPGSNQTVSFTNITTGMTLLGDQGIALEEGYELKFRNVNGNITQISGQGATYPDKVFIFGQPGSHETMVESNYIATYPSSSGSIIQGRDKFAPITDWYSEQYYRSIGYRSKQILASYIGNVLYSYIQLQNQAKNIVLPIGSNTTNELITYPSEFQPLVILISTGNSTQRTRSYGPALEFWEVAGSNSAGTPIVAAKIQRIIDTLQCTQWEARYRARITAIRDTTTHPGGELWNQSNGYGRVDVTAAIAYSGSIPTNPFTSGGNIKVPAT